MRITSLLVTVALVAGCFAGEAPKAGARQPEKKEGEKVKVISSLVKVVSIVSLYTANNINWIAVTVQDANGLRVLNAKAINVPILMHVQPNDLLSIVTQESDDQSWVLSLSFVNDKWQAVDPQDAESDSILDIQRGERLVTIKTRRNVLYKLDPKISYWHKHLMRGNVVAFKYIDRSDGKWVISATYHTFSGPTFYRNTHADPIIVTQIVKGRYGPDNRRNDWYYYISTNHPKIRYEVDSRWNRDVRFQKVNEPPIWHPDRDPMVGGDTIVIGSISRRPAGPEVVVNVSNPVSVSNPVQVGSSTTLNTSTSLSNSLSGSVTSTNNVASTNTNANSNSNSNNNQNNNQNQNQNDNQNQNQNNNNNQNSAQNSNSNQTTLNNSSTRGRKGCGTR